MEVAGFVVNVVTIQLIWKTCLFAIDKVEASQRYDVDVETLLVKLYVERVRLYQWGDALGYTANGSELERYAPDPHVAQAMNGLLTCIKRRLEDSTVLQQKYGVALEEGSHDPGPSRMHDTHRPGPRNAVDTVFRGQVSQLRSHTLPVRSNGTFIQRTKWVIRDRDKFQSLVSELQGFIDGLFSIVNPEARSMASKNMRNAIEESDSLESLRVISTVADGDLADNVSILAKGRLVALRSRPPTLSAPSFLGSTRGAAGRKFRDSLWTLDDHGCETLFADASLHEGTAAEVQTFWNRRLAIERRYANELQDLAQSAASFGIEDIAAHNLVQQLSTSSNLQAIAALEFLNRAEVEISQPCRDIVSAFGSLVKQLPTLGAQQEEVDLLKIQVIDAQQQCDLARINCQAAEKRVSLMRGVEKERALEKLNRERAKEEESLRELGSCQAQWERSEERWKEAWSELCDSLEDLDRRHLHHLANMTKSSSAALATLSQNIGEIAKSMKSASEIFSPDDVLNEFLSGAGSSSSGDSSASYSNLGDMTAVNGSEASLVTSPEVVQRPLPLSPSPSRGSTASSGSNPYHPSPIGRRSSSIRERFLDYMLFGPNNGPQPSGQRPGS